MSTVKRIFKKPLRILPFIGAVVATDVASEDISILDIIEAGITADFDSCFDFKIKGICVWIKCTLVACDLDYSIYIEHYTPEGVVSVYQNFDDAPFGWSGEVNSLLGGLFDVGSGANVHSDNQKKKKTTYRIADVIGSPAAEATTQLLSQTGAYCEAGSTALQPYFLSASNPIMWNTGLVDSLTNYSDLDRWIGERSNNQTFQGASEKWGNLYPRVGVNLNNDHFKSSAVIATRAIDYVFNGGNLIYSNNFGGETTSYYKPAEETQEYSDKYGKWQMLYPKTESKCHLLGQNSSGNASSGTSINFDLDNISDSSGDGWTSKRSTNGNYAWHYWRQYECCQRPEGYSLLFKVMY